MGGFNIGPWQRALFGYGVGVVAAGFQAFILLLIGSPVDQLWGAFAATTMVSISLFDLSALWVEYRFLPLTAMVVAAFIAFCGAVYVGAGIERAAVSDFDLIPSSPDQWLIVFASVAVALDAIARGWESYAIRSSGDLPDE